MNHCQLFGRPLKVSARQQAKIENEMKNPLTYGVGYGPDCGG